MTFKCLPSNRACTSNNTYVLKRDLAVLLDIKTVMIIQIKRAKRINIIPTAVNESAPMILSNHLGKAQKVSLKISLQ